MNTYRAYCITPFFTSWLGNGTSRLTLPVTLTGGWCAGFASYVVGRALAGFEDDDEMAATVRYGIKAELGLAGGKDVQLAVCGEGGGSSSRAIERTSQSQPGSRSRPG